jgi:Fe-S-cluster containining protein
MSRPPGSRSSAAGEPLDAASLAAVTELAREFLQALCDPDGGARLHGMYALDAPVRHMNGIGPAAGIAGAEFAAAHRDVSLRGAELLPCFADPVLLQAVRCADAPQTAAQVVAWLEARESGEGRRLVLALGLQRQEDAWRIAWCTLAERVERWSFEEGLLQSLADYPWMNTDPTPARALLDAGYFRRYWRAPVRFNSLADARFSCQMSTACCRHDYEIALPPEAQLLIDAMPWHDLDPALSGTRLPQRADGKLLLKGPDEVCRFLGPGNLCRIHQTLGRQPFGACCVFPFSFARTPDGIAVGLSPICGSVRRGFGISPHEREDDLRERLVHAEPRSTDAYRLAPGIEVPWERFRDIEKALCDCLAANDVPMRRRLYVGARLLGALRDNQPIDLQAWLAEPPASISADLRAAIHGMLARIVGWERAALRSLPREIPDLREREASDAPALAGILRNTLYCKVYSYPYDLTSAHNHLIVLYLLTLVMEAAAAPLEERMWRELGSLGVHGLLGSMLHEGMPAGFRDLLGSAEMGLWMLAA